MGDALGTHLPGYLCPRDTFGTFFHEALAIAPLVYPVFEMRVQDLYGYRDSVTGDRV